MRRIWPLAAGLAAVLALGVVASVVSAELAVGLIPFVLALVGLVADLTARRPTGPILYWMLLAASFAVAGPAWQRAAAVGSLDALLDVAKAAAGMLSAWVLVLARALQGLESDILSRSSPARAKG